VVVGVIKHAKNTPENLRRFFAPPTPQKNNIKKL